MDNESSSIIPVPVFEEVWYLVHNKKLQAEILLIRKKYGIPPEGFEGGIREWSEKSESTELGSLTLDIGELGKRCRVGKGKYFYTLDILLDHFVFSNRLKTIDPKDVDIAKPRLNMENDPYGLKITLSLSYDTTKTELIKVIKDQWKNIRKAQKLSGGNLLSESKDFQFKSRIWEEFYKKNKTEGDIEKMIEKGYFDNGEQEPPYYLSKYDIKKIIKAMNNRISASFE